MAGGEDSGGPEVVWRVGHRLVRPRFPAVMGIINATPDSFHARSRHDADSALRAAEAMLAEGATMLDIGGMSTRPGALEVPPDAELRRVVPVIDALHRRFPEALLAIDTYRAAVARAAVEAGAALVNDIAAGTADAAMLPMVAALGVPWVAMHMQGTPRTMQQAPHYTDVVAEVARYLSGRLAAAHAAGIADVVLDPGFGFGKTTAHNHALLHGLGRITALGAPVLVGLSRKRMVNEVLGTTPAQALNGTTVLHTVALLKGAAILRVHDVKEAVQAVRLLAAAH
ncbi:MAG: dihydropteroate synthase [Flavobacteriales bacterium]|jgi:dihydropteroate synthase|nr:dihydropteroate synthase [Flavobacteriales bacterium]